MGRLRGNQGNRVVPLPVVDERRCTGCELCVCVCPAECLAMIQRVPWLPRPDHCISCGLCVFICPANALAIADK